MEKIVQIDGKEITFYATAGTARRYRKVFGKDFVEDLKILAEQYEKTKETGEDFEIDSLEIFENVAYVMSIEPCTETKLNIEQWLDQFSMFSIFEILPVLVEIWKENTSITLER